MSGHEVWNFSYGANMNDLALKQRRKIIPIQSRPAVLRDYKLTFNYVGFPFLEPGFGTVEPCEGGIIHGVAHKLTGEDFVRLMRSEGGGGMIEDGYNSHPITITFYDNTQADALVLRGTGQSNRSPEMCLLPSQRYHDMLAEGAASYGVDQNYVNWLRQHPHHIRPWYGIVLMALMMLIFMLPVFLLLSPYLIAAKLCGFERGAWSYRVLPFFGQMFWACFGGLPDSGLIDFRQMAQPFHVWVEKANDGGAVASRS